MRTGSRIAILLSYKWEHTIYGGTDATPSSPRPSLRSTISLSPAVQVLLLTQTACRTI